MKLIRMLHTYWGMLVFAVLFLLCFPFLLIPILFPAQHQLTGVINRVWAKLFFTLLFIPFKIETRGKLDGKKKYIFCANHFSYLDTPTLGLNPVNAIFVGKSDMEKVPLFGFMYGKLHITVDRKNFRSRGNAMLRSLQAIDEGKSLMVFPEGGMVTENPPAMSRFKDGAFRTAIEKQIAVVPVTIPFNWKLLPDENPLRLHWRKVKVIFHEPIETAGLSLDDVDELKEKVFQVIDRELKNHNSV